MIHRAVAYTGLHAVSVLNRLHASVDVWPRRRSSRWLHARLCHAFLVSRTALSRPAAYVFSVPFVLVG